ncbi:MAG: hypothetical protein A4E34_00146 [Methanoregula sp. PtaU1.Bin006]|nr:MAG: hypothetical protein A4E33_02121 [Methanoregula sp. PtaB.Bin085]OPY36966.1 MAG: hypothetical protein A4E34_00146 [Methanoregula sp. PtaU1.Bin006]
MDRGIPETKGIPGGITGSLSEKGEYFRISERWDN